MLEPHACIDCLRRSALVGLLAPDIERFFRGAPLDLAELLRLPNERLIAKVAQENRRPTGIEEVLSLPQRHFADDLAAARSWATCRHDSAYPEVLAEDPFAPAALFGKGDPSLLAAYQVDKAVAIVGARRATSYGRGLARQLGSDLASAGALIVSGLAFGIDGCAHRGALDFGPPIAVLPCGPDIPYPAAHRSIWRRICERGLVLSEFPPGARPWRWTFTARSRIIASLAAMTIVVEAGVNSGSLATVAFAEALEREVGAVPGPVDSPVSVGPNSLLTRPGVRVVRDAADVRGRLAGL